jgi:hypothetical protein
MVIPMQQSRAPSLTDLMRLITKSKLDSVGSTLTEQASAYKQAISSSSQEEQKRQYAWAKDICDNWDTKKQEAFDRFREYAETKAQAEREAQEKERAARETKDREVKDRKAKDRETWDTQRKEKEKKEPWRRSKTPTRKTFEKPYYKDKKEVDSDDVLDLNHEGRQGHRSIQGSPVSPSRFFGKKLHDQKDSTPRHRRTKSA